MKVHIYVKNALTKEVVFDSVIESIAYDDINIINANHQAFVETFPDCHVNFTWESDYPEVYGMNFIAGVPLNMELDHERVAKGEMTWQEEMRKWYGIEFPEFLLS